MGKTYGYIRVSTKEQNEGRQLIAMAAAGVPEENLFIDKQSGKDFERPKYLALLEALHEGDLLYVKSIDRLGRDYDEIIEQWRLITKKKNADIVVLDMPLLDTRTDKNLMGRFVADLVLQILSFVAETERANIKQRQKEGIEAARQEGKKLGRRPKPLPDNWQEVVALYDRHEITITQVMEMTGMSNGTFYKRLKEWRGA